MDNQGLMTANHGWKITINSSSYYILSYLVIYFLYQLATALSSNAFSIPAVIYFNKILFFGRPEAWTFDSVKIIFSVGIILALIIGLLSLVIYLKTLEFYGSFRLLFLWGFVHGLNLFVSSIIVGTFFYEGTGYLLTWLYLSETTKMLLIFIGLSILIFTGTLLVKLMLFSANTYYNCLPLDNQRLFNWHQFFRPYLLSTIIIFIIKYPQSLYEMLTQIGPIFILLPLTWMINHQSDYYFEDKPQKPILDKAVIVITIALILLSKTLFINGVRIG